MSQDTLRRASGATGGRLKKKQAADATREPGPANSLAQRRPVWWHRIHWDGVIATCALVLTIYQACLSRQQQRLSVRPVVQLDFRYSDNDAEAAIYLTNHGIGPAEIKSLTVDLDKARVTSWKQLLSEVGAVPENQTLTFGRYPTGTIYPPNFERILIRVNGPAAATAFRKAFDRMHFEVCYCSLYDECWRFELPSYSKTPVDACRPPAREMDQ